MAQDISPGILAQLEALTQGFNQNAQLGGLSPELMAYLAAQQSEQANGGLLRGFTLPDGRRISQYGQYAEANPYGGPEAQAMNFDPARVNWSAGPIDFMLNTDQSNKAALFDPKSGQFMGYEERMDNNSWRDFWKVVAILAGGYFGGTYLSEMGAGAAGAEGVGGAAGAGGGAGGLGEAGATSWADWAAAEGSNALAGSGYVGADFMAGEAAAAAAGGGLSAAQKLAAEEAARKALDQGNNGNNDFRTQERGGYQSDPNATTKPATQGGNMTDFDRFWEGMKQWLGNGAGSDPASWANLASNFLGNNAGGLLGALGGYLDSKDKTITSQTAPWEPAQPYIKGLFNEGADLYGQYKQHPFSPAEQAAYANTGNVLDYINGNAGGLLSGFQANASGANQFSRDNPRRQLIGAGYDPNNPVVPWRPQLLSDFGTSGTGLLRR